MVWRFLFSNGTVLHSPEVPPVSTFLESHPGAYTTTRTHKNGARLLFWESHLQRLANSARILSTSSPHLFFKLIEPNHNSTAPSLPLAFDSAVRSTINRAVGRVLPMALRERRDGEELAVTALVGGNSEKMSEIENGSVDCFSEVLDVRVHVGSYIIPAFGGHGNGAILAVVGCGRNVAEAKYSDWVRLRKPLEKLRPPSVTELLLSNDGDHILEGCVTNFFVVCCKDYSEHKGKKFGGYDDAYPFEVQTAPISDGVLPGIIRQVVIDICLSKGIPIREVAPSWSKHEFWQEAFITNSLRLVQHVEKIQVPSSWESLQLKNEEHISWEEKHFGDEPGMITAMIQKEMMEKACLEDQMKST